MATTSFQGGGYPGRPYGSFAGREPFVPPVVVVEERSGGGIPSRKRRRERVYIKIDDRLVFFKNERSAREYLQARGDELVERVQREVAAVEAAQPASDAPEASRSELPPIRLPKIEVRGSDEAQAIATEIQLRMHAVLLSIQWHDRLRREEELLLLN